MKIKKKFDVNNGDSRFFWSKINIFSIYLLKNSPFCDDNFDGKIPIPPCNGALGLFEVSIWFDHVVAWKSHDKGNFQMALVRHNAELVFLPTITKFRSRAFISIMAHFDDVIDDVTKQL